MTRALQAFFDRHGAVVEVRATSVQGHTPREAGAVIYVSAESSLGSIGGGQLEYMAIDRARQMLAGGQDRATMQVPLGPEIGQCCGGQMTLRLNRMGPTDRRAALAGAAAEEQGRPTVLIFGAGHVGRALAAFLTRLPVGVTLVDSRAAELDRAEPLVPRFLSALPEAEVDRAPPGAGYVVMTHDHALDFLIAQRALARGDAAYVGMIGSDSKRAVFRRWLASQPEGSAAAEEALTCPIGAAGKGDKRPEVIAAFVTAEILLALQGARAKVSAEHG